MLGKRVKLWIVPKTLLCHTLWGTPSLKEGWDLVTGCDRLGSSRWTRCMLKGSFELAGWVTRDFLKLGEGHDTEEFAQSCEQRALEGFVLESLGLAGAQQPLYTATEYRVWPAIQRTTVYRWDRHSKFHQIFTTYSAVAIQSRRLHTN